MSCRDANEIINIEKAVDKVETVNGRLKFSSSDFLVRKIKSLKDLDEKGLVNELEEIKSQKVLSLRPIVNEHNLNTISQRNAGGLHRTYSSVNVESEFISDDYFASLLNEEGIIQVRDSIYKYTPFGLFVIHENSLDHLNSFLDKYLQNNQSNRSEQRQDLLLACSISRDYGITAGELNSLDGQISYFAYEPPCLHGPGGGSPSPTPTPTPTPSPTPSPGPSTEELMQDYIDNLTPCASASGWANGVFGDSRLCFSKFTDRSQIRTKFWNQSYWFFSSYGVKVKHQFKSLGIWYDAKIDELMLGIRSSYHLFDLKDYEMVTSDKLDFEIDMIYENEVYQWPRVMELDNWWLRGTYTPERKVMMPEGVLPEDIDISIVIIPPFEYTEDILKRDYIEANVVPTVNRVLDRFYYRNSIRKEDINGVLITVYGSSKIAYYRQNSFVNISNSKKVEDVINKSTNFVLGVKWQSGKGWKPDYKKIKSKAKGTFKDGSGEVFGVGRRGNSVRGSLLIEEYLNN